MACAEIKTINIGNSCSLGNIRNILLFPNAAENITFLRADINSLTGLTTLALLGEKHTNKMLAFDTYNEDGESTAGENITATLKYYPDVNTGKKTGSFTLKYPATPSATKTFSKLNGITAQLLFVHDKDAISGLETGDFTTIKTVKARLSWVIEYNGDYKMITLMVSPIDDYESNTIGIPLVDVTGNDVPSLKGLYFQSNTFTTATIVFEVKDGNESIVSDLTIGASGTQQFYVYNNTTPAVVPGAVAYDSGTGEYTFTATSAMTATNSVSVSYNEPSVTSELYVTERNITGTIV